MNKKLELEYKGKKISGILIKEDKDVLTVKLSSGYNANLDKKEVKILKEEEINGNNKNINSKIKPNKDLPNITILHTGGTIASKVDYKTGAVSSKFTPEELLAQYEELNDVANLDTRMIANLSSEDIRFKHYNLLLDEIIKEHKTNTKGIIITHGTDTMHYTSAALQYACKNLNIPVILVGAQRSSDRASSDAYWNLDAAVKFIVENSKQKEQYRRVGVIMHNTTNDDEAFQVIDGINVKKMHSSRRDAFKQINYEPFAIFNKGKLEVLRKDLLTKKSEDNFSVVKYNENLKIGFFKAHPNLFPEEIEGLKIYDGVVIEGTGLGHIAVSKFDEHTKINPKNLETLKKVMKKTKFVIGVQTVYGEVNMNIYSSGRFLKKTGILGQETNLITETLFCRLAYCLSCKDFDKEWNSNIEGFKLRTQFIEEE